MERATLLDGIATRATLPDDDAAERAAVATLLTLGEHVSEGEADDLAGGLPSEFAETVTDRSDETPEEFSADEFVARVADREGDGVDADAALVHVRAVMATLADEGLRGELREAREQLPDGFATLFETDELRGA
ncbi:MAG: DUF2267 domain-containing protein [Halosimplex sp.]